MTSVAVVAHAGKSFGGGLGELRAELERAGIAEPIWYEVAKSKYAPKALARALDAGADLVFVWGGDGMVQRCIDAVGTAPATIAILPAGTGNLLARNLGIPQDIAEAVDIGLHGARQLLDVGRINGTRFAVMAGTGLDALMIRDADRDLKDRYGRAAYVWTAAKHLRARPFEARIKVDGITWFEGDAGCVLVGNVGKVLGGITTFDAARPDDGRLDLGVVTAQSTVQWVRALTRTAVGHADQSPLVQMTTAEKKIVITLDRAMPYELDGGAQPATRRLKIRVEPAAVTLAVPWEASS